MGQIGIDEPGINPSKLVPLFYEVLVKPDTIDEQHGSIFIPLKVRDRQQLAEVKSTLIAVGGNAFEGRAEPLPKIGDRVYVTRYSGFLVRGEDGEVYRICNEKDVKAIIKGDTEIADPGHSWPYVPAIAKEAELPMDKPSEKNPQKNDLLE